MSRIQRDGMKEEGKRSTSRSMCPGLSREDTRIFRCGSAPVPTQMLAVNLAPEFHRWHGHSIQGHDIFRHNSRLSDLIINRLGFLREKSPVCRFGALDPTSATTNLNLSQHLSALGNHPHSANESSDRPFVQRRVWRLQPSDRHIPRDFSIWSQVSGGALTAAPNDATLPYMYERVSARAARGVFDLEIIKSPLL